MSDSLPVLREGDRLIGQACIQPAHLTGCDLCDCVRRYRKTGWRIVPDDGGYPIHVCPRHSDLTDDEIHRYGFLLLPGNEKLLAIVKASEDD